jgi:hypothetical protein
MTQVVRSARIRKPKGGKVNPLSEQKADVPVEVGRVDIPSHMGRTRTGTQESPERWGNRLFGKGDRFHPNSKPHD